MTETQLISILARITHTHKVWDLRLLLNALPVLVVTVAFLEIRYQFLVMQAVTVLMTELSFPALCLLTIHTWVAIRLKVACHAQLVTFVTQQEFQH